MEIGNLVTLGARASKLNLMIALGLMMIIVMCEGILGVSVLFTYTIVETPATCDQNPPACGGDSSPRPATPYEVASNPEGFKKVDSAQAEEDIGYNYGIPDVTVEPGVEKKGDVLIGDGWSADLGGGDLNKVDATSGGATLENDAGGSVGYQQGVFSGGSEGLPSGGGGTSGIDAKLADFLINVWGVISGILGEIAAAIKPEGDTGVQPNAGGGADLSVDNGGEIYAWNEQDDEQDVLLSQEELKDGGARLTVNSKLTEMLANSNTNALIPGEADIHILSGAGPTQIINQGSSQDPYSVSGSFVESEGGGESVLTAAAINPITGSVIAGVNPNQYVKLIEHDLSIGGRRIIVDILKSFNIVGVTGTNLLIRNGNTSIQFEDKKTYYSRTIMKTPHNMFSISNKNDLKNFFRLRNYNLGEKNYLIDGRRVVTVGNKAVPHPTLKGVRIAEVREEMWFQDTKS